MLEDFEPRVGLDLHHPRADAHVATTTSSTRATRSASSSRRTRSRRTARCARPRRCRSTRSATRCTTSTRSSSASRARRELAAVAADARARATPLLLQSMYIFKQPRIGGEVTLPPGRDVPLHRPADRASASGSRSRTPRSRTAACGRSPAATARPLRKRFVRAPRRRHRRSRCSTRRPLPEPADGRLVPLECRRARWSCSHGLLPHWSGANRSPTVRHAYSLHCIAGDRRLSRRELAAATGRCDHGRSRRVRAQLPDASTRAIRAGAQGAACTTTSTAGCGPPRWSSSRDECGYDRPADDRRRRARRLVRPGRQPQRPRALPRDASPTRVGVMQTPRGARCGSRPSAPRTWPPTASSTPRSGSRPSCTPRAARRSTRWSEAVLEGFARSGCGRRTASDHDLRDLLTAMRTAARSRGDRRAGGAVARRRRGRLRHRRRRGRLPAHPPPRRVPATCSARTSTSRSTPARRSGCRRSGRRCSGAAPSGSATACASSTTSPGSTGEQHLGRLAAYVRDRRIPLEMCPTSNVNTGACAVDRRAPDRAAAPAALPRHGQHRQPADERHVDVATSCASCADASATAGTTSSG